MPRKSHGGLYYGVVGLFLAIFLGALAGYGTSVRASSPRGSIVLVGAIWGAFVGIGVYLRFQQLQAVTKRIVGACAGVVSAVLCGGIVQWHFQATVIAALVAAIVGALGPEWTKNANI